MANVLAALVPVFLIIALGIALKRFLLPEASHWIALERLTYFVLFPALLVVSIARTDLGGVAVVEVTVALLGAIAIVGSVLMLARRPLSRALGLDGPGFTSVFQGALRWNTYIGLAVSGGLAGPAGLAGGGGGDRGHHPHRQCAERHRAGAPRHGGRRCTPHTDAAGAQSLHLVLRGGHSHQRAARAGAAGADELRRHSRPRLAGAGPAGGGCRTAARRSAPSAHGDLADVRAEARRAAGVSRSPSAWRAACRGVDLLVVAIASAVPSAPNGYVLARQMGGDAPLLAQMLTIQTILAAVTLPLVIAAVSML